MPGRVDDLQHVLASRRVAAAVIEMPRLRSAGIQSMVAVPSSALPDPGLRTRVEQDAFGQRGLARVDVGHDADCAADPWPPPHYSPLTAPARVDDAPRAQFKAQAFVWVAPEPIVMPRICILKLVGIVGGDECILRG